MAESSTDIKTIIQTNAIFWTAPRVEMLEVVMAHANQRRVAVPQLESIIDTLKGNDKNIPRHRRCRLAMVLQELLLRQVLDEAKMPSVPIPVPRPSILPTSGKAYRQFESVEWMLDFYWDSWLARHWGHDSIVLGLAFGLLLDMGLGGHGLLRLLSVLRWSDLSEDGSVARRIHPNDESARRSPFFLPVSALLALGVLRCMRPVSETDYVVWPGTASARIKFIKAAIGKIYKSFVEGFEWTVTNPVIPTFNELLQLGPSMAWNRGLEQPFLITVTNAKVLPTAMDVGTGVSTLVRSSGLSPSLIRAIAPHPRVVRRQLSDWAITPVKDTTGFVSRTEDWCGQALQVLRGLYTDLGLSVRGEALAADTHLQPDRRVTPARAKKLRPLFEHRRQEADRIGPPTSALHLAIDWAEHHYLVYRRVTAESLRKYLFNVFEFGLFRNPQAEDLSGWDREDHEELIRSLIARPTLAASSREFIAIATRQIYDYAVNAGYCAEMPELPELKAWSGGSGRPYVIGLAAFDALVRILLEEGSRKHQILAIVAVLGFYAGLRADEAASLTLKNVVVENGDAYLYLPQGKSPASHRGLPLGLLLPRCWLDLIIDWFTRRRAEFAGRTMPLRKIAAFGPEGNIDSYRYDHIITDLIAELKYHFGAGIDFHVLRHSFCSHLLTRWYACREHDFISTLEEGGHEVYSDAMLRKLVELFTLAKEYEIPDYLPSDIVIMTILVGHASPRTYFTSYVHTFHAIQRHAIQRVNRRVANRVLSGKLLERVLPKMNSRTTRSKLSPGKRTISGVAALHWPKARLPAWNPHAPVKGERWPEIPDEETDTEAQDVQDSSPTAIS